MSVNCKACLLEPYREFGEFENGTYVCFNRTHPPKGNFIILINDLEDCGLLPEAPGTEMGSVWIGM
jgi:hypothetical protein